MQIDIEQTEQSKGYSEQEMEVYKDGYTDALQDIADGCFEVMSLVKDGKSPDTSDENKCRKCGTHLIMKMGDEQPICPKCEL